MRMMSVPYREIPNFVIGSKWFELIASGVCLIDISCHGARAKTRSIDVPYATALIGHAAGERCGQRQGDRKQAEMGLEAFKNANIDRSVT
ncbi:hypothetical protein RHSP_83046 [Rhizobium freirei PRF 81]|uniref:Uncharacterized protein n=1 Tax=Rhizobium freirei PRF 81 TaxID=363754 RepID=N6V482_9HYPH|nr:hypothetical protein RHSP_83046 [Rhizobium freirei PRF 81]